MMERGSLATRGSGVTGFAGAAAVREWARRGERIAVRSRDAASVAKRFPSLDVEARAGDVSDPSTLTSAFAGIETVINCVQFPNSPIENKRKGWTFEQVDYFGTVHQVEAARDAGVKRFVYVSGVGATLEAAKHWFIFKARAEGAVRASDMTHVIIRPTWLFGPEDVSLNRFLGFARWLPFVPMFGDGQQAMPPLFIDDLGRLLADASGEPDADNATVEAGGAVRLLRRRHRGVVGVHDGGPAGCVVPDVGPRPRVGPADMQAELNLALWQLGVARVAE